MEISQFFINGDIKGAIAYMRGHEEFRDILPAYTAIFEEQVYRTYAYGHPWIKFGRSLEELVLNIRYGNFAHIWRSIGNRIRKIFGKDSHW
mgnify:CR=1 FL=1